MIKSPLRTFFALAIIFLILGYSSSYIENSLVPKKRLGDINELKLARYYVTTGQVDKAIQEYKSIIDNENSSNHLLAYQELNSLLNRQSDEIGSVLLWLNYLGWYLTPKFYILSWFFGAIWLILIPVTLILRRQKLVILPFVDLTGRNLGEMLPRVAVDRLKQLNWRMSDLESKSSIISETLEVPMMGLVDEEDFTDVSAVVETALNFSGGLTNIPLSRLITTIRLWIEQPKFMLKGYLRASKNSLYLDLILINRSSGDVEKTWSVQIQNDESDDTIFNLVNALIFPLLYHFSDSISARDWAALENLYCGLEEFYLHEENGYKIVYLQNAKRRLEVATTSDPNYYLAKYNLGLILLQMGEIEQARDLLRDVAKLSSNVRLVESAKYSYAVALLQLSQAWSYKRAVEVLTDLVQSSKSLELSYLSRSALAIVYSRMISESNKEYYELAMIEVSTLKSSSRISARVLASAFAAEGFCQMASNSIDDAIESFLQAQKLDPKNSAYYIGLGTAYLRKDLKDNAIDVFKRAEVYSPFNLYTSYKLGNIYRELGDHENAIQSYKRADGFALAHLMLGKMFLEARDYDNALSEFRLAVSHNKKLIDGWINISWTICEMASEDENLLHEAETSARRALQLERKQNQLWHRHAVLSRVLLLRNKLSGALSEANEAVKLGPGQAQSHFYLALAQFKNSQPSKALQSAHKVIELDANEWGAKAKDLVELIGDTKPKTS